MNDLGNGRYLQLFKDTGTFALRSTNMEMKDILCATDLTPASHTAVKCALALADRAGSRVKMFHVIGHEEDRDAAEMAMNDQLTTAGAPGSADMLVVKGEPLDMIADSSGNGHWLLVLATHGLRGLRQKLFGADILKLVRRVHIPSLVVQEESPAPLRSGPFVMPVAAHEGVDRMIDMVIALAQMHAAEVHVYQLIRPGEAASDELLRNKLKMTEKLTEAGVRHKVIDEPRRGPSIGFAGPTIEYAQRAGAALIAMMSHASKEYTYMADAEKERLLTNEAHIPILCC